LSTGEADSFSTWALYHENKQARWEAETSAADRAGLRAELSQLTSFLWMGSLLRLIDLVQHVSQLSHSCRS
jgi:hypothetical protein